MKRKGFECKILYAVIDLEDSEQIKCIGNIHEIANYAGVTAQSVREYMSYCKKNNKRCQYIKLGTEEEMESW